MTTNEPAVLRDIYRTGLRNAHAMEAQAQALLQRQIERLEDYPQLRARLQFHLEETKGQQSRLEQILDDLRDSSSGFRDAAMSFMGNMAAAAHMPAEDEVLKNSFASCAFENYEIAAYKSLIAVAQRAGAPNAVEALRQSCREEEAMAQFLAANIDSVTTQYIQQSLRGAS